MEISLLYAPVTALGDHSPARNPLYVPEQCPIEMIGARKHVIPSVEQQHGASRERHEVASLSPPALLRARSASSSNPWTPSGRA